MEIEFGRTAHDYGTFRYGYPDELFQRLLNNFQIGIRDQHMLDVGTGTGYLARSFAKHGAFVTALDPSADLLETAQKLDHEQQVTISYVQGKAEQLPFVDETFDVVTAAQCWHWFEQPKAADEVFRVLKKKGKLLITHFDWIPLKGNVAYATEQLILQFNPKWSMANSTGFYPAWLTDVAQAGFTCLETFTFDVPVQYSHEAWRGRIRASAGVGASLPSEEVKNFDYALQVLLQEHFPNDPLTISHRSFSLIAVKETSGPHLP